MLLRRSLRLFDLLLHRFALILRGQFDCAVARKFGLAVQLAYYPPYHSKYNPIERCWGILEMHWNGSLLDSIEAVVGFARSMTWKGKHPEVRVVETTYATGVRLKPKEMKALECEVVRLAGLGKWFVKIPAGVPDG